MTVIVLSVITVILKNSVKKSNCRFYPDFFQGLGGWGMGGGGDSNCKLMGQP